MSFHSELGKKSVIGIPSVESLANVDGMISQKNEIDELDGTLSSG